MGKRSSNGTKYVSKDDVEKADLLQIINIGGEHELSFGEKYLLLFRGNISSTINGGYLSTSDYDSLQVHLFSDTTNYVSIRQFFYNVNVRDQSPPKTKRTVFQELVGSIHFV